MKLLKNLEIVIGSVGNFIYQIYYRVTYGTLPKKETCRIVIEGENICIYFDRLRIVSNIQELTSATIIVQKQIRFCICSFNNDTFKCMIIDEDIDKLTDLTSKYNIKLNFIKPKTSIFFEDNFLGIQDRDEETRRYSCKNISVLLYTIYKDTVFMQVVEKNNDMCAKYKELSRGIKLSTADAKKLIDNICNIPFVPSVRWCNNFKNNDNSINALAFYEKKYLLLISNAQDDSLCVSGANIDSSFKQIVGYKDIFKLLDGYDIDVNTQGLNDKASSFYLYLLHKKFTLGRGYGVYPIINGEILIDEIFYSFDQKEIIDKMKELFERHN